MCAIRHSSLEQYYCYTQDCEHTATNVAVVKQDAPMKQRKLPPVMRLMTISYTVIDETRSSYTFVTTTNGDEI